MSLFSRGPRSLHERHAAAHAIGQNVRSIFHDLADELEDAANEHALVAEDAHDQIDSLVALRDSADGAALESIKQAAAIRSLVS